MSMHTSPLHDLVQVSLVRLMPCYTHAQATLFRQRNDLLTLLVREEIRNFFEEIKTVELVLMCLVL